MFKNIALIVLGVILGATMTYIAMSHRASSHWIPIQMEGKGLAYSLRGTIFDTDIPMPDLSSPTGQAKFVDRGMGKGIELGFIVKAKMDKLDTTKLPAKYKNIEKHGGYTVGPTDAVVYDSHIEFTLKDADGFVLMTTNSDTVQIWSGQENVLQGFAKDVIPSPLESKMRRIQMQLVVDKCDTCQP